MSVERYVEQIPQSNDAVPIQLPLERGPGNFLLFVVSTANVTITLFYDGVREIYANVTGGIYLRRKKPWNNLRIDGAVGTPITFFYGNEETDKDETDVRIQTTVLAGVSPTADQPAAAVTDTLNVAVPNAAQTHVFPVNNARRRIAVQFASNSAIPAATAYFRARGGVNNLTEISPGVIYSFVGFYGLDVRNDSGGALNALVFEES